MYHFKLFNGYLLQNLLSPFFNTLSQFVFPPYCSQFYILCTICVVLLHMVFEGTLCYRKYVLIFQECFSKMSIFFYILYIIKTIFCLHLVHFDFETFHQKGLTLEIHLILADCRTTVEMMSSVNIDINKERTNPVLRCHHLTL